jgi:hypothetical protein
MMRSLNELRGMCDRKLHVEKDSKEEGKLEDDCTVLYQDSDASDVFVETKVELNSCEFKVTSDKGKPKVVPFERVLSFHAEDTRTGELRFRDGCYTWISSEEVERRAGSGGLEQITGQAMPRAAVFVVSCSHPRGAHLQGEKHTFVCSSKQERDRWLQAFAVFVAQFKENPPPHPMQALSKKIKEVYNSTLGQSTVAVCIFFNFCCMAAEAQFHFVEGSNLDIVFQNVELFFTVIFCIDLALNMCCNFFWSFVSSGWNWFDTFVITTAVISQAGSKGEHGAWVQLRLLRAFRVLRFFRGRRIKNLRL